MTNKRGRDVSLFLMSSIGCTIIENMTMCIDNIMESVEIKIENGKNIFVNCIYRAPASCMDQF